MQQGDTICALATAPGVGAIAVIRVSGPQAFEIVHSLFRGKDLREVPTHTVHFGTILYRDQALDEVLATVFRGPKSYTGEDTVELSCHGSPYIRQQLVNGLIEAGARHAEPGEFTLRAFLNGKLDLSQAEAVADLIASDSEASHKLALQQMRGGFSQKIGKLREELIHFASMLELELDFSEEDVEFADRSALQTLLTNVHRLTQNLLDSFRVGNVLKHGVPVVIAGKPNAGKSTLLNRLLNEERAIVSEVAGTTRDVIEDQVVIDGLVFRFMDTAGIRDTQDTVEAIGVEKTLEKLRAAAIVIYVFDVHTTTREELQALEQELSQELETSGGRLLWVGNKADGLDETELRQRFDHLPDLLLISAKANTGISILTQSLVQLIESEQVTEGDVVVSNSRHYQALQRANGSVLQALHGLDTGVTSDFIAMDIRQALHYLGEITGEITTDDLLGNIFSKFCIGK
ncbi:MAG: tRNA uridine-5-carboxymethylaminomethyl(34) synthesis GTPase MnmE [Leptolyngbya sp. SIO3F4]|nr:tRNA uridine-5-carboxymethylaminomethyl(34) synthesis GTPase MnmE [Leptolyngbya sp. SIO3F4]